MALDDLDRERPGRFVIRVNDGPAELRSPLDMTWQEIAACIDNRAVFIELSGLPGMPLATVDEVRSRWIAHFGLTPDDRATRRLAGIMDKYANELEADFPRHYPGVGPADLWRARKWRCLLNLIDHLPQNTHYHHALMNDPEHAKRVAEHKAAHPEQEKKYSPPWHVWSPEYEALQGVIDELRILRATLVGVNGGKPGKPELTPKPTSEIREATYRKKLEVHESLASRILSRRHQST